MLKNKLLLLILLIQPVYGTCLKSQKAGSVKCFDKLNSEKIYNDNPTINFYRSLRVGTYHRKCRLQPTCSLFFMQAIKTYGPVKGTLIGLARPQMQHDHQDGYLKTIIGADGLRIYLDSLLQWDHN